MTTVKTTLDSPPPSQKTIDSTLDLDLPFDANSWREVKEKVILVFCIVTVLLFSTPSFKRTT